VQIVSGHDAGFTDARIAFTAVTPAKGAFMRLKGPITVLG